MTITDEDFARLERKIDAILELLERFNAIATKGPLDQTRFVLSPEAWDAFVAVVAALDQPAEANEEPKALMAQKPRWENTDEDA